MDAYTLHLLGMAVEARPDSLQFRIDRPSGSSPMWAVGEYDEPMSIGPTLTDALAALLRDLGVEVPERPTPQQLRRLDNELHVSGPTVYGILRRADRLAVLALLEEGS